MLFNEDTFEQAIIELFENMDYTHIYAPDMNRTDYSRPLLDDVLRDCLVRLNRSLPAMAIDEAILKLNDFDAGSLLQKNIIFMDYLQNGITVKYAVKGEERSSVVKLIDYADADSVQHGQRKSSRLAGTGLGAAHQIPAGQHRRDRRRLNGRRGLIACLLHSAQKRGGQIQFFKCHGSPIIIP